VRADLKKLGRKVDCSVYKEVFQKMYAHNLDSLGDAVTLAKSFAQDHEYRKCLLDSEKAINSGNYEVAHKQFDALRGRYQSGGTSIFHTYKEFKNMPPITFAIDGFLQNDGITFIGGLSGHGKTFIMLSMAKALLSGKPLWGYFAVPKKVKRLLYLIPECGIVPVKHRLKLLHLLKYVKDERLRVHTLSAGPKPKLDDPRILAAAKGSHIFLDTAIRFGTGGENDASDNQEGLATDSFALLAAGARTVVGAHHSPKAFERANYMSLENLLRGTGDIGAMLATAWGVKQIERERNILHIENVKPRDFTPCAPFQLMGRPYIEQTGAFLMVKKPGTCKSLVEEQPKSGGATVKAQEDKARNIEMLRAWEQNNPALRAKDAVKKFKAKKINITESAVRTYRAEIKKMAAL
jgi:hypothetical protein